MENEFHCQPIRYVKIARNLYQIDYGRWTILLNCHHVKEKKARRMSPLTVPFTHFWCSSKLTFAQALDHYCSCRPRIFQLHTSCQSLPTSKRWSPEIFWPNRTCSVKTHYSTLLKKMLKQYFLYRKLFHKHLGTILWFPLLGTSILSNSVSFLVAPWGN